MSSERPVDQVQLALITAYAPVSPGETAFHELLTVEGFYDDVPIDLPHAQMAALVAGQNRARAVMRRMGIWPRQNEIDKAEALTRALLQSRT